MYNNKISSLEKAEELRIARIANKSDVYLSYRRWLCCARLDINTLRKMANVCSDADVLVRQLQEKTYCVFRQN